MDIIKNSARKGTKIMEYNSQCGCKPSKINGIKCEAKECEFHAPGDKCEAGEIIVGCPTACCSSETNCTTFRPKKS